MPPLRRACLLALPVLLAGCAGPEGTGPSVPPKAPATAVPEPPAAAIRLAPGLTLSLVPYLQGVETEDLPGSARREVEILACEKASLKLRWTSTVRVERAESARRREDWVRARSNAPPNSTPVPAVPPEYETRTVGGTIGFPDFETAGALLLPGLLPEGTATLKGSAALWLSRAAFRALGASGRAEVPFYVSSRLLKEPARALLRRASELVAERAAASEGDTNEWRVRPGARPFLIRVDGRDARVPVLTASSWFGVFEVLADEANPLVVSVLPDPPSSTLLDLFAPANVLKTLLGYRVASATHGAGVSSR